MRSILEICGMNTMQDVTNIRNVISNQEGIIACEINRARKEVQIFYDDYFITINEIIQPIEDLGYAVNEK